jgi:hypothetical protein
MRSLVTTDSIPYSIDGKNVAARPLGGLEGRCGLVKRQLRPDPSLGAPFCFAAGFPEAAQEVHLGSKNLGWQNSPIGPSLDARGRLALQHRRREPFLSYIIEFGMS